MKKIIAMAVVLCIALMTFVGTNAAEPAAIKITAQKGSGTFFVNQEMGGRQKVELEDVIVVNVDITGAYDAEICSGIIYIKYDSTAVDCMGYKSVTGGTWEVNDKEAGSLRMAFSKSDVLDDGTVMSAAFKAKNVSEDGLELKFDLMITELLTGDVVNGDTPADYMVTQGTAVYTEMPEDEYLMGDANLDNGISTSDAVIILKHSADMLTLEGKAFVQADVNYDKIVNTSDAVLVLKYAAGMINHF